MTVSLSSREIEIIELVAEGLTNQEIAERLTISKRTVDNHVSNVFTNATGHLQHGLDALVQEEASHCKTAHPHNCSTAISDIDGMDMTLKAPSHLESMGCVSTSRRHHFSRNGDGPSLEAALQR